MRVDFAFVCDYAEAFGKINALGIGFDRILVPQIPHRHPHFSLVVQLRASTVEAGQKSIKVNVIDEDGKDIVPALDSRVTIPKPESGTESIGRFVIEFGNVEFRRYGVHSVRVSVEQTEVAEVNFAVSAPPTGSR